MNVKKLTRREFARAVKLGHGRALLHVMHYGDAGIENEIEQALLTNNVYDMQIEGSRTYWLQSLLAVTGNVNEYARRALMGFGAESTCPYDLVQQIRLCGVFFEFGFSEFRQLMFRLFQQLIQDPRNIEMCACELIDVAGVAGLEFVAKCIGGNSSVPDYECAAIHEHAKSNLSESMVIQRMKELSTENVNVKAFLNATIRDAQSNENRTPYESPQYTLEEILSAIRRRETGRFNAHGRRFGKRASDADIQKVFELLLHSTDCDEQNALLQIFTWRTLPKFDRRLLHLLTSTDRRVRFAAVRALSNIEHRVLRQEALWRLNNRRGNEIIIGLDLLQSNYRECDIPLITSVLKRLRSPEEIHSAGMALRRIAEKKGGAELAPIFLWLYNKGPDTFCREDFFRCLLEWDACPAQILFESQWDAGEEVRALARNHLFKVQAKTNGED